MVYQLDHLQHTKSDSSCTMANEKMKHALISASEDMIDDSKLEDLSSRSLPIDEAARINHD